MCDQCSKIFKTDKKHDPSVCPIALSLVCSCCKIRGHATLKCTNYHLWTSRVPEFLEQLIPLSLRIHHAIPFDQKTPIPKPNNKPLPCPHILLDLAKERMENARLQINGLPISEKSDHELNCSKCRPTLEVPADKDGSHTANIRATLASYNLPNSSGKENVKQLTNFAAMNGKKLVLTKNVEPIQKDDKKVTEKTGPKKDIKIKKVQEAQPESPKAELQAEKPKKTLKLKTSGKAA